MRSYTGKLLRINLSNRKSHIEDIPEQWMKNFLGGRGLAARYLYDELKPGVEPLGPDNKLLLMMGPLGATTAMSVSRMALVTKSPLTGAIAKSVMGGNFGAYLKFAGFDGIIVEGEAEKPTYVHIDKDGVHILDADGLWGLDTQETHVKLRQRHGKSTQVACIGPAGEGLVRYAIIISDRRCGGRTGVGTVMGAKKLKAIAVNSAGPLSVYDPERFKKLAREQIEGLKTSPGRIRMSDFGTAYLTLGYEKVGIFPVKNFQEGHLEDVEKIGDEEFAKIKVKNDGCYGCMTKCGQVRQVTEGSYAGAVSEGPDYETIWALGGNLANTDKASLVAADSLCDRLGIDTVSVGNSIGFAYELFQRGIITKKDTDGLELKWGDHSAMMKLVEKIGNREGFGKLLGEGTKRAAEQIGKGAEDYAMHVKGLELPAYEPRAVKGYGLVLATSNVGAHHMYGRPRDELSGKKDRLTEEDKGKDVAQAEISQATQDAVIQCSFGPVTGFTPQQRSDLLVAATGFDEFGDPAYLDKIGERILCLERSFNVREGFSRKDDTLPKRMQTEPLKNAGPATGQVIRKLDTLLDEYYDALGYTSQGIPSIKKLRQLGLEWAVEDLNL
ncbi:MAG: aldehyde ferredoxin oxidoreductase family protein [Dehalococcoidales bacterium]|nr:aldehyde ferredoxin oxidoreductase family protein [Dehalococcoidales bacterium]